MASKTYIRGSLYLRTKALPDEEGCLSIVDVWDLNNGQAWNMKFCPGHGESSGSSLIVDV